MLYFYKSFLNKTFMRNLFFATILISVFFSCKKEAESTTVTPEIKPIEVSLSEACYIGIFNKDTVSVRLSFKDSLVVTGDLTYKLYEKDENQGTLSGTIKGDTLIADYTFTSEGVSSVRQVAFLRKDNILMEGFGEVIDTKGKMVFKDIQKLKFDNKRVLSKSNCEKVI